MTFARFLNPFRSLKKAHAPHTLIIDQNFTKNSEPRAAGKTIQHLILHYTGCPARVASARFLDATPNLQGGRLSTHYMVDENGRITQFVHEKMRAWHAGKSFWDGETDINSTSIGIEIVNMGEYGGYPDFNTDQITVVIDLCRDILRRNPGITPFGVLGHSDIAPGRKLDPGPKFPWAQLAAAGVGVLPLACHPGLQQNDSILDQLLTQFGYNPETPLDDRIEAFCTHYAPDGLHDDTHITTIQTLTTLIAAKDNVIPS